MHRVMVRMYVYCVNVPSVIGRLEFYGVELFPAKDHHGIDLSLGITTDGIAVFKSRTIITTFLW